MSVSPTLDVLSSKQHPRKLKIKGSDGRDYPFLLKGEWEADFVLTDEVH
jgi:FKBP12-rapamycin complex-associated protein